MKNIHGCRRMTRSGHLVCSYHVNWIRSGRECGTGSLIWSDLLVGRMVSDGCESLWSNNTLRHICIYSLRKTIRDTVKTLFLTFVYSSFNFPQILTSEFDLFFPKENLNCEFTVGLLIFSPKKFWLWLLFFFKVMIFTFFSVKSESWEVLSVTRILVCGDGSDQMKHYRGPEGTKGFWRSHKPSDNRPLFGLIVFIFYWKPFCVAHQNMSSLGLRTNTKTCSLLNVSDQVDVSWLTSVESSRCSDGILNQNVCLCFLPSSERSDRVRPKAAASTSSTDPPSRPVVVSSLSLHQQHDLVPDQFHIFTSVSLFFMLLLLWGKTHRGIQCPLNAL